MPLHIPITADVYDSVGTDVVHRHDAEVSEVGGAYLKKKEITLGWLFGHGRAKVAFDLKSGVDGVPVYAQLYKNDVVAGTLRARSSTSYATFTETLSGLVDEDAIELYLSGMPARNLVVANDGPNTITVCGGIVDGILDVFGTIDGYTLNSPAGLTWDGTNLYFVDSGPDQIYVLVGVSNTLLRTFAAPSANVRGLAYDGTNLIAADDSNNDIVILNKDTGAVISRFNTPGISPSGITFDGTNLISCDSSADRIYVHDGVTAAILTSFPSPGTGLPSPQGLAFDGVNLISCDDYTDKIYVHDGVAEAVLRTIDWSLGGSQAGITTYYYASAAIGYAKNLRVIGSLESVTKKASAFENTL